MINPKMSRKKEETFRLNQPYAGILSEAISQGKAIVPEAGMARYLGRVAQETQWFMLSRPRPKTSNTPHTYLIPTNYMGIVRENEKYILFKIQNNNRR